MRGQDVHGNGGSFDIHSYDLLVLHKRVDDIQTILRSDGQHDGFLRCNIVDLIECRNEDDD